VPWLSRGSVCGFWLVDVKPPICRVCGKAEWNHVCGSGLEVARAAVSESRKEVMPHAVHTGQHNATAPVIIAGADPRFVVLTDEEFMLAYRPWQAEYMRRYRKRGG
jgi:hypothetical protein